MENDVIYKLVLRILEFLISFFFTIKYFFFIDELFNWLKNLVIYPVKPFFSFNIVEKKVSRGRTSNSFFSLMSWFPYRILV